MDGEQNHQPPAIGTTRPDHLTGAAQLPSGELMAIRPLRVDDAARFGAYLCGLSTDTRARYGPHPFNQKTADAICASLDHSDILRMAATVPQSGSERIIAYMLLKLGVLEADEQRYNRLALPLKSGTDATLAPSVADDFQDQGVGSLMMRHILRVAPGLGRRRIVLWGGVQATNARAIHFYTKLGFRRVGEFYENEMNNYDMILDLPAHAA